MYFVRSSRMKFNIGDVFLVTRVFVKYFENIYFMLFLQCFEVDLFQILQISGTFKTIQFNFIVETHVQSFSHNVLIHYCFFKLIDGIFLLSLNILFTNNIS